MSISDYIRHAERMKRNYRDGYECEAWVLSKLIELGHTAERISLSDQQHSENKYDVLVDRHIRVEVKFMNPDSLHPPYPVRFPRFWRLVKTGFGQEKKILFDFLVGVVRVESQQHVFVIPSESLEGRITLHFDWPYNPEARRGIVRYGYKRFDPRPFYNRWDLLRTK